MLSRAEIMARMGLDNKAFKHGLRQSESFARKSVGRMVRVFGPFIGIAGFGGATRASMQLADTIGDLAVIANTSNREFQRLSAGAEQYSVSQEKLAKILNNSNKTLGQFIQTGKGPLLDFFKNIAPQVDLTAESFRNLSGPQALQLYYNALEQAGLPQSEMIYYLEQLSARSSKLIPLLRDNGAEFKRLGDAAEAAGAVMSGKTIDSLERAEDRLTRMKRSLTVLWGEILVKVIPVVQIISNGFGFLGDTLGVVSAVVVSFGKALGTVVVAAIQPAITAFEVLGTVMQSTSLAIKGNFTESKKVLLEAKDQFVSIKDDILNIGSAMSGAWETFKEDSDSAGMTFDSLLFDRNARIQAAYDELNGKADAEAARIRKEREELEKEIAAAENAKGETGRSRNEAEKAAKEADEKRIQALKLAVLEAEITGKQKLIDAARKELEYEQKVQQIISETNVSRERALKLAEELSGKKRNSGKMGDGVRFETRVGAGGKREKVFYKDGRKLGTAEAQDFRSQRFGTAGAEVGGVPSAGDKMAAMAAAGQGPEPWQSDITAIRQTIEQLKTTKETAREIQKFLHGFLIYHIEKLPKGRSDALAHSAQNAG